MRNIVILNSLHFSYPLPILMRVSYNTLIVKQNTSDYYKYKENRRVGERKGNKKLQWNGGSPLRRMIDFVSKLLF